MTSAAEPTASKWPSLNLSWVALVVSLGGGFNFGYQLLITNPAQGAFIQFLNDSYLSAGETKNMKELEASWGFIVSLFFWGATVGAFLIQSISDRLGRKRGMILSFIVQLLAVFMAIISYFLVSWLIYAASRVLLGAAISVSIGIAPLFITECSPAACRGIISLATGIMIQVALVVGAVAAMPQLLGRTDSWWLLYAGEGLLTIIVTLLCFFINESPGYLFSRGKTADALVSLKYYHQISDTQAEVIVSDWENANTDQKSLGLFQLFSDSASLRGTVVGCFVMGAMIMSGIAAINAFAYEILLSVGLEPLQASIGNVIICIMTVFGVLFSSVLVDAWGRRPLLISTFAFLAVTNAIICAFMWWFETTKDSMIGWCIVGSICVFNFVFCVGPGPVSFFVTGELVGQNARGAACTWANIVMNGVRSLLLAGYYPLKISLGGPLSYFVLFFPPCALAVVILFFYLPESKGRTPEETQAAIKHLPSLRKKKEYSPVELQPIAA